jgi:hypothetical protein
MDDRPLSVWDVEIEYSDTALITTQVGCLLVPDWSGWSEDTQDQVDELWHGLLAVWGVPSRVQYQEGRGELKNRYDESRADLLERLECRYEAAVALFSDAATRPSYTTIAIGDTLETPAGPMRVTQFGLDKIRSDGEILVMLAPPDTAVPS